MKKEAIVLFPCAAVGHLVSMVEFGKLLATHRPSLSVQILIFDQGRKGPNHLPKIPSAAAAAAASCPSITFHYFTTTTFPQEFSIPSPHIAALAFAGHRHLNPELRKILTSISDHHRILALALDLFCTAAQQVAEELSIPCYYFFASGAGFLNFVLYLSTIHDKYPNESYNDPGTLLDVPGIPPLPVPDLVAAVKDRIDAAYEGFLETSRNMGKSAGIVVNTFERLEPRPVRALRDGQCVSNGPTPPAYCIGPLVSNQKPETGSTDTLGWLDSQPSGSVIFLSFGSMGVFPIVQLKEMAVGLERSGHRFLWVVRNPSPDKNHDMLSGSVQVEPDLELLLPDGFLDRTKERGLVVMNWAPQVAVLNHGSVGGFVTHCGWNSVLEAVSAGVPMIGWPLYAEQRQNKLMLVEEMKIALPMNRSNDGLVSAAEVENRVKELMDSEVGGSIRKRVLAKKEEAEAALGPVGSSRVALVRLIESLAGRG